MKMKNSYQPGFRKVRTPKPKINTEVDIAYTQTVLTPILTT